MRRILFILPLFVFFYCKPKKSNDPEPENPFDKQALVVNMADNVILPDYNAFKSSLDSLITVYSTFKTSGLLSDFQLTKQKLHSACMKYQRISPYEFGPAEQVIVRMNFNVFPTDTPQIKSNIAGGTYDLSAASNLDAKGFPALDFLFYGNNQTEADVMSLFTASSARKQYVSDLLNDMSVKINSIIGTWSSSYRTTFVNSLSTDVGSSIGFLVNQLNFELDYLKNSKIGIPLGKKTLGIALPEKCEAYYEKQSVQYALETLKAIERVYNGGSGKGFDDYLDHLKADYNGTSLNSAIQNQFSIAKNKLSAVPDPLSAQIISNPAIVDAAYAELMKLLVLLKTDMPSSLGVIITYQDGDGD
jgi:predicted lipoprotein